MHMHSPLNLWVSVFPCKFAIIISCWRQCMLWSKWPAVDMYQPQNITTLSFIIAKSKSNAVSTWAHIVYNLLLYPQNSFNFSTIIDKTNMTPPNLKWKWKWFTEMNSWQWISYQHYLASIELLTNGSPVLGGCMSWWRSAKGRSQDGSIISSFLYYNRYSTYESRGRPNTYMQLLLRHLCLQRWKKLEDWNLRVQPHEPSLHIHGVLYIHASGKGWIGSKEHKH